MNQLPSDTNYQHPPQSYYSLPPQEEREVNLRDYLGVLRKRMWTIIAFFLIVVITTAVGTFTVRPVYRATATIQIDKENPQIVDFREIFAVSAWDVDYYQTHHQILASRQLARRIVNALKLSEHPEFIPGPENAFQRLKSNLFELLSTLKSNVLALLSGLMASSHKDPLKESQPHGDSSDAATETFLISQFISRLSIEPVRNTRLVRIHFDSHYPELSSQVSNVVAKTYIQMNLESRMNATEQAREQLNEQLESMKGKMEQSDEELQAFGSEHGFIFLDEKEKNVVLHRLSELNEALAKAESERMAKEALYRQTRQGHYDAIPSILENKLIQDLRQKYVELEVQYSRLSETFKPGYPEMVRIKKQMETIQRRLDAELNRFVIAIKNEFESCLRKESMIRTAYEQQKGRATEMQQKAIGYYILKREADTNRELYKNLLQRMKEAGIAAGIKASNIQVVDQAEVPASPFKPNIPRNVLLAAVVGLLLGVGLAFFFEFLDNTIKTPEDVEQMIRLPSFGMVPEISYEKRKRMERGEIYPVELVTFGNPKSMLSEAYRNIRTSILLSFSERPPKTLVVSSPNPMEGKTTTAINMAIAFAQTGAQVLIIDADLRKPRLHKIFNKSNGMGLSNYLSGNADIQSVIKKSNIPNLCYIPCGPVPPNPSELLGSNLFKNTVQLLGNRFDNIIIDSPPVLSFVDSLILSNCVDGVILVVLGGKTPREALLRSKGALLQVNAKILGVVVNRVDIQKSKYGYYYYQHYSYYEQDSKEKKLPYSSGKKSMRH